MTIQRLGSQLQQGQVSGERKERDFDMAIRARDEAVKENQRLAAQIDSLEDRERQKVGWDLMVVTSRRG